MNCECCGTEVNEEKKHVIFSHITKLLQFTLCKSCLRDGMMAPTGSIIKSKKIIAPPKLAFPFRNERKEFCTVAREEGWLTQSITSDCTIVEEHYKQAMMSNYFTPGEGWKKNTSRSPVENFRRSCRNIKDNYPQWLKLISG